ncbi:glycoside hydrolase family 9 protein [Streptomyces sp. XC 2026]|nr:glycoside hydrolase family 9 protein [Streptomyces sp. XC 2026]
MEPHPPLIRGRTRAVSSAPSGRHRRRRLPVIAGVTALLAGSLVAVSATASADSTPHALQATGADEGPELIVNGDFSNGTAPWWWTPGSPAAVVDGQLCADVPGGTLNAWDAIIGQDDLPLTEGETYALTYTATASVPVAIRSLVQLAEEPWTTELAAVDPIGSDPEPVTHVFTAKSDNTAAQLAFQLGGHQQPYTFCLDDVSLRGGAEPPVYEPDTGSPVRVNQVGYLTEGPKRGTLVSDATSPLSWSLRDADGTERATGSTTPVGVDPTSEQHVHTFDLGAFAEPGEGYTVAVDGEVSEPFAIGDDLYSTLRTDALAYFYHNRSGIEIEAQYVGEQYARPAGHLNEGANQGDFEVPCRPGQCDYTLDAHGGWYDAGDHGKYVVNGGISVAQLMSSYERTLTAEGADGDALGDGTLAIPEQGNGVPDILDEARWQLEFLLRMQVPAGEPLAGMAHHKLHDREWTGLPLRPDQDPQPRELAPPSTAATLNLAAAAAQCARLYAPYDAEFADRCASTATTAWQAALANPERYAPATDGQGGGAYEDSDVRDEFYWAAAELFVTTGEDSYRQALLGSELHGDVDAVFPRNGLSWQSTAGLGALSLATVDSELPTAELAAVRALLIEAADGFAADSAGSAYGVPYDSPDGGGYFWGSNSQVLNNMVVLGTAYDLAGDPAHRDALLRGFDYLLGANPLNLSYVTGYGERYAQNQHHRFWANQLNPALPNPPPGSVAGGPNQELQDPVAEERLAGCAPAMCYIDHIESYATNEVTINWNAPLAWVASFADDLTG